MLYWPSLRPADIVLAAATILDLFTKKKVEDNIQVRELTAAAVYAPSEQKAPGGKSGTIKL